MPKLVFDPRFLSVCSLNMTLESLCTGAIRSEEPVWLEASQTVVWSDIPDNRMLACSAAHAIITFRAPPNFSHDNTLDREGRMVTREHGQRCVSRTEHDGAVTVRVDRYQGRRLNSPNDVVAQSDGANLGKILLPETITNRLFGEAVGNERYIAASSSLHRVLRNAVSARRVSRA